MTWLDLSHVIRDNMITYPGLPGPSISEHLSRDESAAHYSQGTTFHIGRIEMIANTGTYLDSPFHRYEDGPDVSRLPLDRLAGLPGRLIEVESKTKRIDGSLLDGLELSGRAVLFYTGWDRFWGTPDYGTHPPHLTQDAAELLRDSEARLVGIDSLNIDSTRGGERPVHSILLSAGIPIVEHLTGLNGLKGRRFSFYAVPPPVEGMGSFPVRAFAEVEPSD